MDSSTETMTILRWGGAHGQRRHQRGGGRRVRTGAKPDPLGEKLAAGRPAIRLEDPLNEPFDFAGNDSNDIGDGAVLAGETMPEPSDYLSEIQHDGKTLGTDLAYRETRQWLDQHGCSQFVAPRPIEAYAQAFARYMQCEQAISKFGLLGKHPTTGASIASPFVATSQSFEIRRKCIGASFTRLCAPPAPPTRRAPRPVTR